MGDDIDDELLGNDLTTRAAAVKVIRFLDILNSTERIGTFDTLCRFERLLLHFLHIRAQIVVVGTICSPFPELLDTVLPQEDVLLNGSRHE